MKVRNAIVYRLYAKWAEVRGEWTSIRIPKDTEHLQDVIELSVSTLPEPCDQVLLVR